MGLSYFNMLCGGCCPLGVGRFSGFFLSMFLCLLFCGLMGCTQKSTSLSIDTSTTQSSSENAQADSSEGDPEAQARAQQELVFQKELDSQKKKYSAQVKLLKKAMKYNASLCEKLYEMRLECPLLNFIIERRDRLVECATSSSVADKQEHSWLSLTAGTVKDGSLRALSGTWTLEMKTAKYGVFKASVPAKRSKTEFARLVFQGEGGARDSPARLEDVIEARFITPSKEYDFIDLNKVRFCFTIKASGIPLSQKICDPLQKDAEVHPDDDDRSYLTLDWQEIRRGWHARAECKPQIDDVVVETRGKEGADGS